MADFKAMYDDKEDCFGLMFDPAEQECIICPNSVACNEWKEAKGEPTPKDEKKVVPKKEKATKKDGKKKDEPKPEEPVGDAYLEGIMKNEPVEGDPVVITEREELAPETGVEPEVVTEREDPEPEVSAKVPAKGKGKSAKAPAKPAKKAPAKPAKKEAGKIVKKEESKKAEGKKPVPKKEASKKVQEAPKEKGKGKDKGKKAKPAQKANTAAETPKKSTRKTTTDEFGFRAGSKTARYFELLKEGTHTVDQIIKLTSKEFKCHELNNYGTFKVFLSHLQSTPDATGVKKYSASRGIKVVTSNAGIISLEMPKAK